MFVASSIILNNLDTKFILKMVVKGEFDISTMHPEYILLGPCYHLMMDVKKGKISQSRPTVVSKKKNIKKHIKVNNNSNINNSIY